ncbi:MAG: NAD-dependent epimerase/dehydratase family protein [Rhizobiales bacterium]|nr:NAD-dependent epimerase/dehydratase family protein [Hyphomicrobiales bacterium]
MTVVEGKVGVVEKWAGEISDEMLSRLAAEDRRLGTRIGAQTERRVLVVGGAGYIGGPVTARLLAAGHHVRCLDLLTYGHAGAISGFLLHPRYEFLHGDMGDAETLERALADVTDVVILAGLVGDPITKAFPAEAHVINDIAMRRLIDALDGRGLNKVIFVSTCSNYGLIQGNVLADENHELNPLSLYAKSKVAAEQHLLGLEGKVDYAVTVLRFATAFGLAPRMRFDLTVNEFVRELGLGRELVVFDAHTWRPYCHVRDFARLIDRVLDFPIEDVAFEVFNAGGDANNHTKQSIVDLVLERLPAGRVAYRENSSDPRNYRVSFEKVRRVLQFTPAYSVGDGIDEVLAAMASHLLDDVDDRRNFYGNHALARLDGTVGADGGGRTQMREVA